MVINSQVNTLQEEAIIQITKLIISGELKLGQRINEVELSHRLNMSRGPIRESLRILNQQGLLTYESRKGMFVTNITPGDLVEIYDIILALEKSALDLGFENLTDEYINSMRRTVNKISEETKSDQRATLVSMDSDFHEHIIKLPGYNRLQYTWKTYNNLLALTFAKIFEYETETIEDILSTHTYLIDTLEKRDKNLFKEILTKHYEDGKNKLLEVWK